MTRHPPAAAPEHLNVVDAFVKRQLLMRFDQMPSRDQVLEQVLLGRAGAWRDDAHGFAVVALDGDEGTPPVLGSFSSWMTSVPPMWKEQARANRELQDLLRDWTRRHIDLLCSPDFHFEGVKLVASAPSGRVDITQPVLLARMPANVHPDWREACVTFARDTVGEIRHRLDMVGLNDEAASREVGLRLPDSLAAFNGCQAVLAFDRAAAAELRTVGGDQADPGYAHETPWQPDGAAIDTPANANADGATAQGRPKD